MCKDLKIQFVRLHQKMGNDYNTTKLKYSTRMIERTGGWKK